MTIKYKYIYILLAVLLSVTANAQENLTLYHMKGIQQSMYQNPAKIPENKLNISLPVVSSTNLHYNNNGFAYADLVAKRSSDDSLVLTIDNMLSKLKDNNTLTVTGTTDLFGIGFKVKRSYWSFNAAIKADAGFNYSKDLLTFALKGNSAFLGKTADLSFKLNTTTYFEYGLGFAQTSKNQKLSYGVKFKLLSGMTNTQTDRTNITVFTNESDYSIKAKGDILFNTASIDTGDIKFNASDYVFGKNTGTAFDLGFVYKATEKLTVSASVTDIGAITWNDKVSNYKSKNPNASFDFNGFSLKTFFDGKNGFKASLDSLGDSLRHTFDLVKSTNAYKTNLTTKIYAGASYKLNKTYTVNALFAGRLVNSQMQSNVCLSVNAAATRWLNITGSYSITNGIASNIGLGTSINAGPFQFYFVTDNVMGLANPDKAQNINLQAGLNLRFGRAKATKATKSLKTDKPKA